MRVISGTLKGRIIEEFNIPGTRPTMDRVKESLFAMIQNYIPDAIVLDLFAGSGSLGIEALSNGSKFCCFNDVNSKCAQILKRNLSKFELDSITEIYNLDFIKCLEVISSKDIRFDIIFLDPPYQMKLLDKAISEIINNDLINDDGIVVCEVENDFVSNVENLIIIKEKKYGDKKILIFKFSK